MIDRKPFFALVRVALFGGRLTPGQVAGMGAILDGWELDYGTCDPRWLAYALGTVYHETARTMRAIEEYGRGAGRPYGERDPETGEVYYGRGLVQLTWRRNYERAGRELGLDLVHTPAIALRSDVAVRIMFRGMVAGWFTGAKFGDFFGTEHEDWIHARRIINGSDCAEAIAGYARTFHAALGTAPATGGAVV